MFCLAAESVCGDGVVLQRFLGVDVVGEQLQVSGGGDAELGADLLPHVAGELPGVGGGEVEELLERGPADRLGAGADARRGEDGALQTVVVVYPPVGACDAAAAHQLTPDRVPSVTPEQWIDFIAATAPPLTAALIALATAVIAFWLNDQAARKRQLRERQDAAMEHVMDAFGTMQRAERLEPPTVDAFVDSLIRFTWLLDARDEVVTNWVNAKGAETVTAFRSSEDRFAEVARLKAQVVLGLRDWRLRPVRTRRRMLRDLKAADPA